MSELKERFKAKAKSPRRTAVVKGVPEIGDVTVRSLMGDEYDEYESLCAVEDGKEMRHRNNRALLIKMAVIDEDGKNVFSDSDMEFLKNLTADVTVPIATKIMQISGVTKAEQEATEKN